jgi:hypothetical protein
MPPSWAGNSQSTLESRLRIEKACGRKNARYDAPAPLAVFTILVMFFR